MAEEIERRFFATTLELRAEDGRQEIIGYGAVFKSISEDLGGFREIIEPGSFDDVLGDDVRSLFNHDPNLILGRTTAKTLVIETDDLGLRYTITPPETTYANDLIVVLKRGDVNQSSFAFKVARKGDEWEEPTNERPYYLRHILKVARLYDVSPVTFPAYQATSVALRNYLQAISTGQATGVTNPLPKGGKTGLQPAGRLAVMRHRLQLIEIQ